MSKRRGVNSRSYPDTMASAESGRPMKRGLKLMTITVDGQAFDYYQPGWWCDLDDPGDREGQLENEDNQAAKVARLTAEAIARGEAPAPGVARNAKNRV